MIRGREFHTIVKNVFGDVNGYDVSEQLQVNCPMCQQREGLPYPDGKFNLEINTSKRMFRCWKCDEPKFSGSLGFLIRRFGSPIDLEMYKSYSSIYGDYVEDEFEYELKKVTLPNEMILFSDMDVDNPQHLEAYNYLVIERKISRDIIYKFRLGFCITGKFAKRIIIPSYDKNGNVNYFVGRTYDKTEKKKKYDNPKSDKDLIIFNEGFVNWDFTVFLVEGAFEMLTFPVNTIPLLGKTLSSTLFMKLKELKPHVVVLLDPDAYKNSIELFYTLKNIYVDHEDRVRLVKLPTEDDLDELRRNKGTEEVVKSLYTARGLTIEDYFISNLEKPYDRRGKGRFNSNSKNYEWKSSSGRTTL